MSDPDYKIPNDNDVSPSDIHPGTKLSDADLSGAVLQGADLTDASLLRVNLIDANLEGANLSQANLKKADLTGSNLKNANLSNAYLYFTDLSGAYLEGADLPEAYLWGANCNGAYLMSTDLTNTNLFRADLTDADLRHANLTDANLEDADLTDADLRNANLTNVGLERATVVGTELLDANLTGIRPYAARITDVQINDGTDIDKRKSEHASWWQRGPLAPAPRCGYDLALRENTVDEDSDREEVRTQAADTYREFEKLAHDNTRPSLESSMFVRRQEMQQARYRERGEYLQYGFAVVSGSLFKYGESLGRVLLSALLVIAAYAAVYARFDLILDGEGFIESSVDTLYFSTLTFTTLGLGDYQPDPASELARLLVTSQAALGAVLIAIFVFVLGRRAAR